MVKQGISKETSCRNRPGLQEHPRGLRPQEGGSQFQDELTCSSRPQSALLVEAPGTVSQVTHRTELLPATRPCKPRVSFCDGASRRASSLKAQPRSRREHGSQREGRGCPEPEWPACDPQHGSGVAV